jgi:hypothetical protein
MPSMDIAEVMRALRSRGPELRLRGAGSARHGGAAARGEAGRRGGRDRFGDVRVR